MESPTRTAIFIKKAFVGVRLLREMRNIETASFRALLAIDESSTAALSALMSAGRCMFSASIASLKIQLDLRPISRLMSIDIGED